MKNLKLILGVILLPLVFATFMADRIILLVLFWLDAPSMGNWIAKEKLWAMSITRLIIAGAFFLLFTLINWLV
jgi:hypothetical protein